MRAMTSFSSPAGGAVISSGIPSPASTPTSVARYMRFGDPVTPVQKVNPCSFRFGKQTSPTLFKLISLPRNLNENRVPLQNLY